MQWPAKPSSPGLRNVTCTKASGSATGVKLKQLGKGVIEVDSVEESSPLFGKLQPGDRVHSVVGKAKKGETLTVKKGKKPTVEWYCKILIASVELSIDIEGPADPFHSLDGAAKARTERVSEGDDDDPSLDELRAYGRAAEERKSPAVAASPSATKASSTGADRDPAAVRISETGVAEGSTRMAALHVMPDFDELTVMLDPKYGQRSPRRSSKEEGREVDEDELDEMLGDIYDASGITSTSSKDRKPEAIARTNPRRVETPRRSREILAGAAKESLADSDEETLQALLNM